MDTSSGGVDENALRALVARYWNIGTEEVRDDLHFSSERLGRVSSLRFLSFIAAVENVLGIRIADPTSVTSYGALRKEAGLEQGREADQGQARVGEELHLHGRSHTATSQFGLGHHMQEIAQLPEPSDFLSDSFYTSRFTASELSRAAQAPFPLRQFAGMLCIKQALIGCHEKFHDLHPNEIEVDEQSNGIRRIAIKRKSYAEIADTFTILVSEAHTDAIASAVVLVADVVL